MEKKVLHLMILFQLVFGTMTNLYMLPKMDLIGKYIKTILQSPEHIQISKNL